MLTVDWYVLKFLSLNQLLKSACAGSEADAIRVKVLAAEQDLTLRLTSAETLFLQGLLSQKEFDELRVALVAQL